MTAKISASADGLYGSLAVGATEAFRFGSDNSGQLASFRNKLINGNFSVWQRGGSGSCPIGQRTYTADRWFVEPTGAAVTFAQTGGAGDFNTDALLINGAAGVSNLNIQQRIEKLNAGGMVGNSVTLSFYLWSNASGITVTPGLGYPDAADNYTTFTMLAGATSSPINNGSYQKITRTFTNLPAGFVNGAIVNLQISALGAGQTVTLDRVQLEEGSIATPFEQRPIGLELSLCQRYYLSTQVMLAGTYVQDFSYRFGITTFPVTMRVAPSMNVAVSFGTLGAVVSTTNWGRAIVSAVPAGNSCDVTFSGISAEL